MDTRKKLIKELEMASPRDFAEFIVWWLDPREMKKKFIESLEGMKEVEYERGLKFLHGIIENNKTTT